MLRRFWNVLLGRRTKRTVVVPDSERLPAIWIRGSTGFPRPNLTVLSTADTKILTELCDIYWYSSLEDIEQDDVVVIRDRSICRQSLEILGERGSEVIEWARRRLQHPGYDAREEAACLLGTVAARGKLGSEERAIAAELASLATRPWHEDPKELQANNAAMNALRTIGGDICLTTMRKIIESPEWDDNDIQWDAAQILSDAIGQKFMETSHPVQAAKAWIRSNP
jgi:hypothetical protein